MKFTSYASWSFFAGFLITVLAWTPVLAAPELKLNPMSGQLLACRDHVAPYELTKDPEVPAQLVQAREMQKAIDERKQNSKWLLAIPAILGMGVLVLTKKKRNRTITSIGIALAFIVGLSGLIWGAYVSDSIGFPLSFNDASFR